MRELHKDSRSVQSHCHNDPWTALRCSDDSGVVYFYHAGKYAPLAFSPRPERHTRPSLDNVTKFHMHLWQNRGGWEARTEMHCTAVRRVSSLALLNGRSVLRADKRVALLAFRAAVHASKEPGAFPTLCTLLGMIQAAW
jgi:hypothetical protein